LRPAQERVGQSQQECGAQLDVIYTSNDGTFGIRGHVTAPLEAMLPSRAIHGLA
jgi:glutamate synthase (NADPH/NADH) small chain